MHAVRYILTQGPSRRGNPEGEEGEEEEEEEEEREKKPGGLGPQDLPK